MNITLDNIRTSYHQIPEWTGLVDIGTYGGKPLINLDNSPVFAEIYALKQFQKVGFAGIWIDNYRRRLVNDMSLQSIKDRLDIAVIELLKNINGKVFRAGTWDLLLWDDNNAFKFVELKRTGKDNIRTSQLDFLERAIDAGYKMNQFEIYEWDLC